jgi:hypothetical protein
VCGRVPWPRQRLLARWTDPNCRQERRGSACCLRCSREQQVESRKRNLETTREQLAAEKKKVQRLRRELRNARASNTGHDWEGMDGPACRQNCIQYRCTGKGRVCGAETTFINKASGFGTRADGTASFSPKKKVDELNWSRSVHLLNLVRVLNLVAL